MNNIPDWPDDSHVSGFMDRDNRSSQSIIPIYPSASSLSQIQYNKYDVISFEDSLEFPVITDRYGLEDFVPIVSDPRADQDNFEEEDDYEEEDAEAVFAAEEDAELAEEDAEPVVASEAAAVVINQSYVSKAAHKTISDWLYVDILCNISPHLVSKHETVISKKSSRYPLELSNTKIPDVAVFYRSSDCILQIEVHSGFYDKTCRKLVYGIVDQLIIQRNKCTDIIKCEGLYFPTAYKCNIPSVVRFEVTWNDSQLSFKVKNTVIPMADVQSNIIRIVNEEMRKISMMRNVRETNHKLPLTKSYIIEQFGRNARQIQSGESIVIVSDEKVYKYPLLGRHRERLFALMVSSDSPQRFLVPERPLLLRFFVYPKLKPPISIQLAKQILKPLTKSVVLALKELHSKDQGHADVRLENICFRDEMAVLIDLDMGGTIDLDYKRHTRSRSIMYPNEFDIKQLDWRQLVVMIVNIVEPRQPHEYHTKEPNFIEPSVYNHLFIQKLYEEGKRSESNMVIVNLILLYLQGSWMNIYLMNGVTCKLQNCCASLCILLSLFFSFFGLLSFFSHL